MFQTLLRSLLILVLALAGGVAHAGAPGPGTKAVRDANTTIAGLLARKAAPGSAEEHALAAEVTTSVRGLLDVDQLGRLALADHWDGLSEAQRAEYLGLLRGLIEDNYVEGLRANLAYDVVYEGEAAGPDGALRVETKVKAERRGRPYTIDVDYVLRNEGGAWRAYDVVTDGVGLVENYRAQFNKIIARDGFDGLIAKMKKKRGA